MTDAERIPNAATGDLRPNLPAERPDLVAVGGWLLFLCIGLTIIRPIATLLTLIQTVRTLPAWGVMSRYPRLIAALALDIAVPLGLTGLAIYAGYRLWSIRRRAVASAKMYFIVQLVASIVLPLIGIPLAGLPGEANTAMVVEGLKGFATSLVAFLIWFSYLNRSVRVRVTYRSG